MAKSKKLIVLSVVLAVFVCFYVVIKIVNSRKNEDKIEFMDIKSSEITELKWQHSGEDIIISKDDSRWIRKDNKKYPVNQTTLSDIANSLEAIKSARVIEDADKSEFGIGDNYVEVVKADNENIKLFIGDTNSILGECYIQIDGDDKIYLVNNDFKKAFDCGWDDLLEKENIPYISEANEITISAGGDTQTAKLTKKDNSEEWANGDTVLEKEKIEKIKNDLNSLAWDKCVEYGADKEALSKYGFDLPNSIVTWKDDSQSMTLVFGNKTDDGEYYAMVKDSDMVYTVSPSVSEFFSTDVLKK